MDAWVMWNQWNAWIRSEHGMEIIGIGMMFGIFLIFFALVFQTPRVSSSEDRTRPEKIRVIAWSAVGFAVYLICYVILITRNTPLE